MKIITILNDTTEEFYFHGHKIAAMSYREFYEDEGKITPTQGANIVAEYYSSSYPKEVLKVSEMDLEE